MSVRDHHVTCQEIVELVTEYLELSLDSETAALFEEHINFCDGCEAYLGQMRATIETVASIEPEEPPAATRERLINAFREFKGA
jgi:predicted anti-sigma-YlaC factor YlaD